MSKYFYAFISLLLFITIQSQAVNYYWVGGSGSWTDLSHWATSSGGSTFHSVLPSSADNVYFDWNSFTADSQKVTININASCLNMNWWYDGPVILEGSSELNIYGSLDFNMDVINNFTGKMIFRAQSPSKFIDSRGITFNGPVQFDAVTGTGNGWNLYNKLVTKDTIFHDNGDLNTNGYDIQAKSLMISSPGSFWSVDFGNSNIVVDGSVDVGTGTGTAINGQYATIRFNNNDAGAYFYPRGQSFKDVVIHKGIRDSIRITSSFVAERMHVSPGTNVEIGAQLVLNVDELHATGRSTDSIRFYSDSPGLSASFNAGQAPGSYCLDYVSLNFIDVTGGVGTHYAGANSTNVGGSSSGWTFNSCPGYYWVGGSGNWSDAANHWAMSSGGNSFHSVPPSSFDNVVFDENSFSGSGEQVTVDGNRYCDDMVIRTGNKTPIFVSSDTLKINGDLNMPDPVDFQVATTEMTAPDTVGFFPGKNEIKGTLVINGGTFNFQADSIAIDTLKAVACTLNAPYSIFRLKGLVANSDLPITLEISEAKIRAPFIDLSGKSVIQNSWNTVIHMVGPSVHFDGGLGSSYYKGVFEPDPNGTVYLSGWNDFNNFNINTPGAVVKLDTAGKITFYEINVKSSCLERTSIQSVYPGYPASMEISSDSPEDTIYYVQLQDIASTGFGPNLNCLDCIDLGNNSGSNLIIQRYNELSTSTSTNPASCFFGNDGDAAVTVSGGTGNHSILWSNGPSTTNNPNLTAGTYYVTVTDSNGCFVKDTASVLQPSDLVANAGVDLYVCDTKDTVILGGSPTASGGTIGLGTYLYSWSPSPSLINPTDPHPKYSALATDTFIVEVTDENLCKDTDTVIVTVNPLPVVSLGNDTAICSNEIIVLDAGNSSASYIWSNLATTQTITVNTSGTYHVQVTDNNGCIGVDTIGVNVDPIPVIALRNDTTLCQGDSVTLDAGMDGIIYSWGTGATVQSIVVDTTGMYWVQVTNTNNCSNNDTVNIAVNSLPVVNLGADTAICEGQTLTLNAGTGFISYLWSDLSISQAISVDTAGSYSVTVKDINQCRNSDTIDVTLNALPPVFLGNDTVICAADSLILDGGTGYTSYLWSTGVNSQMIKVGKAGTYSVQVIDANDCQASDIINVSVAPLPIINLGPDKQICPNDSAMLDAGNGFVSYNWTGGETLQKIAVKDSGVYTVEVANADLCKASDSIKITLHNIQLVDLGNDQVLCQFDTLLLDAGIGYTSYEWQDASTGQTLEVSTSGIYHVNVVDVNGCKIGDTISVQFDKAPLLRGKISANDTTAIVNGRVYVIKYRSVLGRLDTVYSTTTDANGLYEFPELPKGKFLVLVKADQLQDSLRTMRTYFPKKFKWDSAQVVTAACKDTVDINIDMITLKLKKGSAKISGIITKRSTGKTDGDPVPDVDVVLEQIPGGVIGGTKTDGQGFYEFSDVPAGQFKVLVDIPGLDQKETHDVDVDTNDTEVNKDFYVDSTAIYTHDSTTSVFTAIPEENATISIYPNPFRDATTIEYTVEEESLVNIEVVDMLGKNIILQKETLQAKGTYNVQLSTGNLQVLSGILFVKIRIDDAVYMKKIIDLR